MKVDVFNMEGKKVSAVELPSAIFEAPINVDLMHQAYVRQMANARLGTHSTKGRSQVTGGGRKPYRQKGTGRARQGSRRAAQFVGGGKIHTPKPRDYSKSMPLKMRRSALRSALSAKFAAEGIVVVDALTIPEPKTRLMAVALDKLVGDASALILLPDTSEEYQLVSRSTNNLPDAKTILASYLNIRDLMVYDRLVFPLPALDVLVSILG